VTQSVTVPGDSDATKPNIIIINSSKPARVEASLQYHNRDDPHPTAKNHLVSSYKFTTCIALHNQSSYSYGRAERARACKPSALNR